MDTLHVDDLPEVNIYDLRLWKAAANDTCPAWARGGRRLWLEDDSGDRDRERIEEAWHRLFGVDFNDDKVLATWDGGDVFAYLHTGGRVAWAAYDGGRITRTALCPVSGNQAVDRWNGIGVG